jgi:PadR family transcriptional regulator, regulatory protein PadR
MADDLELLQGTLDVLVLKTLSWGPRHGYAVARWIHDTSLEELRVEDRALYVSLHRLEARGWVESEWGLSDNNRKAKYYQLTTTGGTVRHGRVPSAADRLIATLSRLSSIHAPHSRTPPAVPSSDHHRSCRRRGERRGGVPSRDAGA